VLTAVREINFDFPGTRIARVIELVVDLRAGDVDELCRFALNDIPLGIYER